MRYLRTNTATRVTVGPFVDKTDGVTPETSLTVTSCKLTLMVDTAGVPTLVLDTAPTASGGANDMVHVTGDDAGFYDLELAAANVNYVGRAVLSITDAATHCPVFHEFTILPTAVYDIQDGSTAVGTAQTGDAYARLGAPAGASVSADVAAAKTDTAAIKVKTDFLPSATAGAAGGVFIAGTNAATAINTSLSINGTPTIAQTGDSFARIGLAGVGLTNVGDTRIANLDAAMSTRMATYTQPAGFLAATFPSDPADQSLIIAAADAILARLPAALTANGNLKVSLQEIITTALTEGATGRLAAAFIKLLNVATPTGTVNSLPDAVAGATNGLAIVGSNVGAAASVTAPVTLSAAGSAAFTESYAADGAAATLPQILYMILALLSEFSITGTTLTPKKLDGTTPAGTFTLNDATTPTAITRAS